MKTVWILCLLAVQNLCHGQTCADLQTLSLWGKTPLKDLSRDSMEKIGTLYIRVTNDQDLNGIEQLTCLRELIITGDEYSNNSFSSLPAALLRLKSLEVFKIEHINVLNWTEVFGSMENLTQLKKLTIKYSGLTDIPETVHLPSSLEIVELPINRLTVFPEAILKLKKLRVLNLEANNLKILPTEIGRLLNLEELHLGSNKLAEIPDETGNLKALKKLDLSFSKFAEFPQSIESLSELTELDLHYNGLKNMPSGIAKLTHLKKLNLSGNQISKIPSAIGKLSHLKVLDLSRNRIRKIPSGISALENLKSLLLADNLLTSLPDELCSLSKLMEMNVSNNRLTDLPGELKQLEAFDVRGNNFKTEPELFLFYKSKMDSASQKYDSIMLIYNDLNTQVKSFNRAYDKFLKQSLEKDSLTNAFQMLAIKMYEYNGLDSKGIEEVKNLFQQDADFIAGGSARDVRLDELPPLMIPVFPYFISGFKQDFDKSHFSYSIAYPSRHKQ